ncbi:MAG: hypothetical protein ACPGQL_06295 [Thermoplasmatota archaeon]
MQKTTTLLVALFLAATAMPLAQAESAQVSTHTCTVLVGFPVLFATTPTEGVGRCYVDFADDDGSFDLDPAPADGCSVEHVQTDRVHFRCIAGVVNAVNTLRVLHDEVQAGTSELACDVDAPGSGLAAAQAFWDGDQVPHVGGCDTHFYDLDGDFQVDVTPAPGCREGASSATPVAPNHVVSFVCDAGVVGVTNTILVHH